MRVLLALLLVGIVGCGGGSSSPAQTADADPVAALEKVGAKFKRNGQGEVVEVNLMRTQITDEGLVHLKALTGLQSLSLSGNKITDAGLVHLKGLTKLQVLGLRGTQVTDQGVADLKKALPNCGIQK